MATSKRKGPPKLDESPKERLDRNLLELLNELRVALPGVQVLFAFLLAVPFANGFTKVTQFEKDVYFGTLICTAISTALLIAPSAYHRILFRYRDKGHIVFLANRLTVVGLGFLALAMTGAILLITDFLFSAVTAVITTVLVAGLFAVLWYGAPLLRRAQLPRDQDI
jgi:hypothetical protein